MAFAIKAAVAEPTAKTLVFNAQKTMYAGKFIAVGDTVFVFASENEGGRGLIWRGVVTCAKAVVRDAGVARQTPRVSLAIECITRAKRPLGRTELKLHVGGLDESARAELHFKFYRQATDKIVGLSDEAASFLDSFF